MLNIIMSCKYIDTCADIFDCDSESVVLCCTVRSVLNQSLSQSYDHTQIDDLFWEYCVFTISASLRWKVVRWANMSTNINTLHLHNIHKSVECFTVSKSFLSVPCTKTWQEMFDFEFTPFIYIMMTLVVSIDDFHDFLVCWSKSQCWSPQISVVPGLWRLCCAKNILKLLKALK